MTAAKLYETLQNPESSGYTISIKFAASVGVDVAIERVVINIEPCLLRLGVSFKTRSAM
jgi:hypothetical protein